MVVPDHLIVVLHFYCAPFQALIFYVFLLIIYCVNCYFFEESVAMILG